MLRIYIGRAGAGKTAKIMSEIKNKVEHNIDKLVFAVPEQYSHDAERLLCEYCGNSASLYAQVLSFTRMCNRVFSELGGIADKFVDDAGKTLVMSRALTLASDHLKVYGGLSTRSEFISKLVDTAKEFRSAKITIERIIEAAAFSNGVLKDKLDDIATVFQIYWSLMQNEVLDPDERLDRLEELISNASFIKEGYIWFDGFDDFTVQQFDVIKQIMSVAQDITVSLCCDSIYSDEPVFELSRNTAKRLVKVAEELKIEYEIVEFPDTMNSKPKALKIVEKVLYSNENQTGEYKVDDVKAFACKNFTEECENAAANVIKLVKNGARWKDVAVAVCGYGEVSALLDTVFEKYGVPFYGDSKLDILNLPPVLAIIAALRIVADGWKYEDVFTYLKTGFANITKDECDVIENYVLMWNIRGAMWYRDEPWTFSQDGYKGEADEVFLEKINIIRNKVIAPLKMLQRDIRSAVNNEDRLYALYSFVESISLQKNIEYYADRLEKRGEDYMSECYRSLGEILISSFEQFYSVAGDMDFKLDDFTYQLTLLFSKYDIGVIPTSVDKVSVGDITRLRKRNVKHLIVIGMTDGKIPVITMQNGVFSDSERDVLIANNLGLLKSAVSRLYGDINDVYKLFTMPEHSVIMSYSNIDSAGASAEPSYIFKNIVEALSLDVVMPKLSDYKTVALIPCREFAAIYRNSDCAAASAGAVFKDDEDYSALLTATEEISGLHHKVLTPESAKKLYGDKITMTASRVDKYKSCKYAYFLQYGLKAKPRTKAEFDASVIGTFMHYILENVTRDIENTGGFRKVTDEECIKLTHKYVSLYTKNELQNMQDKTARFKYLFDVLCEDAVSVVLNLINELRKSDFKPLDYELDFSTDGDIPPYIIGNDDGSLFVRGVVDRVDGWVHDGKLFVRVVDYKTGIKSFNLSDVWYGMGLQMLIYLFALKAMGKERYDMEIVPAGILYAPARELLLSASRNVTDAEIEKERVKNLKRSGIILADDEVIEAMENGVNKVYLPVKLTKDGKFTGESLVSAEQLGLLSKHIDSVLLEISKEIFGGNVSADPYYRSQVDNSCMYCDYYHACHFSEETDGNYRSLTKLKAPDVWVKLQKENVNE